MKYKLIEHAYPSSEMAKAAGMAGTGCWFVVLYNSPTSMFKGIIHGDFFKSYKEAVVHAESINEPYHNKHELRQDLLKK